MNGELAIEVATDASLLESDSAESTGNLALAALLHDIARSLEDRGECSDHAETGSLMAKKILVEHNLPDNLISPVVYCIRNHRSDGQGVTKEAQILRDADKLDSLGAICISRVIASSFQTRQYARPVYDPSIPFDGHETASALHYLKLLVERCKSGKYFFTKTARLLAGERIGIMEDFLKSFMEEWNFNNK